MAIGRLRVKVGKRGKASPHAQYITRTGKYEKKAVLEVMEHKAHGNMPNFAINDPLILWDSADKYERKNGTTYREHEIALPRELSCLQRIALVQDWVKNEMGDMPWQYAIHNKTAMDGEEQPHVHLMFCERQQDEHIRSEKDFFKRYNPKNNELGGCKKLNTDKHQSVFKKELKELRNRWEVMCNTHLKQANSNARISMKTNKERGLPPPKNITRKAMLKPEVKEEYLNFLEAKKQYIDVHKQANQSVNDIEKRRKEAVVEEEIAQINMELEELFKEEKDVKIEVKEDVKIEVKEDVKIEVKEDVKDVKDVKIDTEEVETRRRRRRR